MSCFDLTHAPVATTARAAATGPVSMSTRPDPEGSDTEIATRRRPRLRVVECSSRFFLFRQFFLGGYYRYYLIVVYIELKRRACGKVRREFRATAIMLCVFFSEGHYSFRGYVVMRTEYSV